MASRMRFKSNIDEVIKEIDEIIDKSLEAVKEDMIDHAKMIVPVDTGDLKKSINVINKSKRTVGFDYAKLMHYWAHVEFGTSKQRSQPYLRPTLRHGKRVLENEIRERSRRK